MASEVEVRIWDPDSRGAEWWQSRIEFEGAEVIEISEDEVE